MVCMVPLDASAIDADGNRHDGRRRRLQRRDKHQDLRHGCSGWLPELTRNMGEMDAKKGTESASHTHAVDVLRVDADTSVRRQDCAAVGADASTPTLTIVFRPEP